MLQPLQHVAQLLALRALPFAVYWVCSRRRSTHERACAGLLYLGLLAINAWLGNAARLGTCALGACYYLTFACVVPLAARCHARELLSRGAMFVLFAAGCLLLPSVAAPRAALGLFLVIGWELLLSSYSYCCENARPDMSPKPAECLFFLFVNPTVSFAHRGQRARTPAPARQTFARVGWGAVYMWSASALLAPLTHWVGDEAHRAAPALLGMLAVGTLRLGQLYLAHAGLAHIQIGLMRQSGYVVPERYRGPLLARDPFDFWRRWNTYVGVWLRRYVFAPAVARLGGRRQARATHLTVRHGACNARVHGGCQGLGHPTVSARVVAVCPRREELNKERTHMQMRYVMSWMIAALCAVGTALPGGVLAQCRSENDGVKCTSPFGSSVAVEIRLGGELFGTQWIVWKRRDTGACMVAAIGDGAGIKKSTTIVGSDKGDLIITQPSAETHCGKTFGMLAVNDKSLLIEAGGGDDVVLAGGPTRFIEGGSGDDVLVSDNPGVYISGGPGNDDVESWGSGRAEQLLGDDVVPRPDDGVDCIFDINQSAVVSCGGQPASGKDKLVGFSSPPVSCEEPVTCCGWAHLNHKC